MEWEQSPFILFYALPSLGLVLVRGQTGNVVTLLVVVGGGLTAFTWVPLSWFNILVGVAHSLTM